MSITSRARFTVVACLVALVSVVATPVEARAADGSQFDPSYIISDGAFYDSSAMTASEVQNFLVAKVPNCAPGATCLRDYVAATPTMPANSFCGAYEGSAGENAAAIIYKVGKACNISQKVLLVLLQKEQSLVTSTAPKATAFDKATGFSCSDSSPCDPQFAGFFYQLYYGAKQYQRYRLNPQNYNYQAGRSNNILYHPDALRCGSSSVVIQNQATAGLYNYTPYQPNSAALSNLYGTGDPCSSYGNRNFWRLYTDWFGSPTAKPGTADGRLEGVAIVGSNVRFTGWVLYPDSLGTTAKLSMQVGAVWRASYADQANTTAQEHYPLASSSHGFDVTLPITGPTNVCIYVTGINGGDTISLGCQVVQPGDGTPVGSLDSVVSPGSGQVQATGWALDPDALTSPATVNVTIGGETRSVIADVEGSEEADSYPTAGTAHGFDAVFDVEPGTYQVCATVVSVGNGRDKPLGCKSIQVVSAPPVGAVQSVTGVPGGIAIQGWAVDPDTPTLPVSVSVEVGGAWRKFTADQETTAAAAAVPGAGTAHGFSTVVPASAGSRSICVYPANTGVGSVSSLGCFPVTVPSGGVAPQGSLVSASGSVAGIQLTGWAVDMDAPSQAVSLLVQLDGVWSNFPANLASAAAESAVPGAGPNHGFDTTVAASPGPHQVCVYLAGIGAGGETSLGCRTVTVPAGSLPKASWDTLTGTASGITMSGWAVDPDVPLGTVDIVGYAGLSWFKFKADGETTANLGVAGAGTAHGFNATVPLTTGTYNVCLFASNVGTSGLVSLGCRKATVANALPTGSWQIATAADGGLAVAGWAVDPDDPAAPVRVSVQAGAKWYGFLADQPHAGASVAVPSAGDVHGFSTVLAGAANPSSVCVYLSDRNSNAMSSLGCKTVGGNYSPVGALTSITSGNGTVTIGGWAVDPDSVDTTVPLSVQVNSSWFAAAANQPQGAMMPVFPGTNTADHGFSATLNTTPGAKTVCVYLLNRGQGGTSTLGCRTIVVP